ncbi:unnamed protein product, partial [marine sediment metagenome]
LHRPMRIREYDPGTELTYDLDPIEPQHRGHLLRVHLRIERSVGGGFAGQVYQARLLSIQNGVVPGVEAGKTYALKILIPSSGFALFFRNLLFAIGFQSPFQLQCNPVAARCGALWQKFIHRAAAARFGDPGAVNNVHGILVDRQLGACGELSDWIDGRTWRLEVDDRMDMLKRWQKGEQVNSRELGSPEYRTKKEFMRDFVALLHEMGAHEFARQYEWSTCKSQPNCLKRSSTEEDPLQGLVAVDFRAGLTLLPFLPMSPGDV